MYSFMYNISIFNNKGVPFMTVTDKMLTDTMGLVHNMNADQVDQLVQAIKLRRSRINQTAIRTVQVGDNVQFTGRGGATRSRINQTAIRTVQVGDNVQFTGRGGATVRGNVTKKAIKFVTVDTGSVKWKVPANMLEVL